MENRSSQKSHIVLDKKVIIIKIQLQHRISRISLNYTTKILLKTELKKFWAL